MCYHVRHYGRDFRNHFYQVGVRELRQNLSVYLGRIDRDERFEVTDRGNPVALLIPLESYHSPLQRLIAEGRDRAPVGDLQEIPATRGQADHRRQRSAARGPLIEDRF